MRKLAVGLGIPQLKHVSSEWHTRARASCYGKQIEMRDR